jgi:subtilisin family serine protease
VDDCYGWDFENNDNDPLDDNSHGTHVAGIIGAVGDNGIGVSGVCQQAKLLAVKVLDNNGEGEDSNLADGIIYAADKGAKIINLSLESDKRLLLTYDAISYAEEKGAIVVIASGNNSLNLDVTKIFPAAYSLDFDNVVTVSNSNEEDKIGTESNYGSITVDIFAPGENIISTYPDDMLASKTGTSMAAPFISGIVGLLLSRDNTLTPFDVKKRVIASTDSVFELKGLSVSSGRINASKILDSVNRPIILKVYPESFGVDEDVMPNLNEPLEIYGAVDGVYGVYYNYNGNDRQLNFEKVDSKTIKVHTPIVSGDFYIKTLNSSGYSNEVKISPYLNKINLNNAVYAIKPIESKNSDAKIKKILDDDVVDNYTVVGEGFSFYISGDTVSGINIVKTTSTNANTNGAALLKTDNGAIICLEKKDNTYYTSNISTNKDYSFYEVAESCVDKEGSSSSSGGGGGCAMSFGAFNNIILLVIAAFLKILRNYLFIF